MIGQILKTSAGLISGIMDIGTSLYQESREDSKKVVVENAFVTLTDGTSIYIPFWQIETGKIGPVLLLIASQDGNEVQGAEVACRFMELCAKQLKIGTVMLLPVANLPAVQKRRHSINLGPDDPVTKARIEGQSMNLIWPGKNEGNDTERIAYSLTNAVLRYCNYLVDIHCCSHFNAAETISVNDNINSFPIGEVTTTRFISYSPTPKLNTASQVIR
jgi:predicted deacylase